MQAPTGSVASAPAASRSAVLLGQVPAWLPIAATTIAGSLLLRPALRVDETRYLAVAWDMWRRGDFLVPRLSGVPYADKPPLLFWLVHVGWLAGGVNEVTARLVPGLAALLCLGLTALLARQLWPSHPAIARRAPLLLLGSLLFVVLSTVLAFDVLLTACVLGALAAMLRSRASKGGSALAAVGLAGLAIGAGLLCKGPVVLLFLVPALGLLPAELRPGIRGRAWAGRVLLAVAVGVLVALAWVVPAARHGGRAYENGILWGQVVQRVSGSYGKHDEPAWFYVGALPLVLLPAVLWPRLWRRAAGERGDAAPRLWLLQSSLAPVVLLSLSASKQEQYVAPCLPLLALWGARRLQDREGPGPRGEALAAGLALAIAGGAVLVLRAGWVSAEPFDRDLIRAWPAAATVLAGAWIATRRFRGPDGALLGFAAAGAAGLLLPLTALVPAAMRWEDVRPAAAVLARLEAEGHALAIVQNYRGDFDFYGRLQEPVTSLHRLQVSAWADAHPDGFVIVPRGEAIVPAGAVPRAAFPSGARLWDAAALRAPAGP